MAGPARAGTDPDALQPLKGRRTRTAGDALTDLKAVTSYNNFYEFGTDKADPARYAGSLKPSPWTRA